MSDDLVPSPNDAAFYENQLWKPERPLVRREVHKKQVANDNIDEVFELVGGVHRFAEWANRNLDEFYTRIYRNRMVTESHALHSGSIRIVPALPPSALDEEPIDAEFTVSEQRTGT